jgi:hypothetical protein
MKEFIHEIFEEKKLFLSIQYLLFINLRPFKILAAQDIQREWNEKYRYTLCRIDFSYIKLWLVYAHVEAPLVFRLWCAQSSPVPVLIHQQIPPPKIFALSFQFKSACHKHSINSVTFTEEWPLPCSPSLTT